MDVHAHYFPRELDGTGLLGEHPLIPWLVVDGPEGGRIMRGGQAFRNVRSELWDVDRRIAELDRLEVRHQVVSPVPVLLQYAVSDGHTLALARAVNDSTAAAVSRSAGRLIGLGTVPLPGPGAVPELRRAVEDLGLAGVEIGTQVDGIELDDPALRDFFEAAEGLGAAIFVHPMDGGKGVLRRDDVPHGFGLGMLTDTALAATALVFGGVLERFPHLRVGLAHGGGTFPWALPRLELGRRLLEQDERSVDELVRSLWVDSLVFDPSHLRLLVDRFGADHVMLGSDHPFLPDQPGASIRDVTGAGSRGILTEQEVRQVLGENALAFVRRATAPNASGLVGTR